MALSKILLSVDPSLRSTGYNFINTETKDVIHYGTIASDIPAENGEELLLNISGDLLILKKMMFGKEKVDMVIEGLSFGSKTGMRDLIDALHWHIRTMYRFSFSDALIGVAPAVDGILAFVPSFAVGGLFGVGVEVAELFASVGSGAFPVIVAVPPIELSVMLYLVYDVPLKALKLLGV